MNKRTYSEMCKLKTYQDRLNYLKISDNKIGTSTFGHHRFLNQEVYTSYEYRKFRQTIILRDNGCEFGLPGHDIIGKIYVHHINPISLADIKSGNIQPFFDSDNVVCVSHDTHNLIHFSGKDDMILNGERSKGDTKLW